MTPLELMTPVLLDFQRPSALFAENKALGYLFVFITVQILYWICIGIYRLTFHPLAKYPGPWIAAVSPVRSGTSLNLRPSNSGFVVLL